MVKTTHAEISAACPSLDPKVTTRVGREPGSLDIVITMVNFTSNFPIEVDTSTKHECEPRVNTDTTDGGRDLPLLDPAIFKRQRLECDHESEQPCCVMKKNKKPGDTNGADTNVEGKPTSDERTAAKIPVWGTCVEPDESKYGEGGCGCRDCFDYRLRRRAHNFHEVRMMLRSFEENGLHIQSAKYPGGIVRKVFVVYNKVNGNGPPTWLQAYSNAAENGLEPAVIAVPHSDMWEDPALLPSANRNAIAANLHRIPGLGQWWMYLEDDMFLNRPLDMDNWINKDTGHVYSRMSGAYGAEPVWGCSPKPTDGWQGAIYTTHAAVREMFGDRGPGEPRRRGESLHAPRLHNTCMSQQISQIWKEGYKQTTSRYEQAPEDLQMLTHHALMMALLQFGRNVEEEDNVIDENHLGVWTDAKTDVAQHFCGHWHNRTTEWIQVQGDGVSDEYLEEGRRANGEEAYVWKALQAAFWPVPTEYEDYKDGSTDVFKDPVVERMGLREVGLRLCGGKRRAMADGAKKWPRKSQGGY
jgi:hypothetical protein